VLPVMEYRHRERRVGKASRSSGTTTRPLPLKARALGECDAGGLVRLGALTGTLFIESNGLIPLAVGAGAVPPEAMVLCAALATVPRNTTESSPCRLLGDGPIRVLVTDLKTDGGAAGRAIA